MKALNILLILLFTNVCVAEDQVTGIAVHHHAGQTFITWQEVNPPALTEGIESKAASKIRRDHAKDNIRYHIYRSDEPIKSVDGLTAIGSTGQLSCWNFEYYGRGRANGPAPRFIIKDGAEPLAIGSGLYVHNAKSAGAHYYAVTYSKGGEENKQVSEANAIQVAVTEIVGQGEPVFQRSTKPDKFQYVKGATLNYYTRWEAPPHSSVENRPIDYLVALPPTLKEPWVVGLHLHCWNRSLNKGYGWWDNNKKGAVLVSSNQEPYDWWTGYNEHYFSGAKKGAREAKFKTGVVRPYTMNRTFGFLDWLTTKHDIDLSRTFVAGNSMGGSGAVMCAVRYGERIASCRSWVGVHIAGESPGFTGSYEGAYGQKDWGIKFEDGTPVFDYYSDVWYLKNNINKETGFITFSNGKNDGGIGWPQAVKTVKAMQETKRPHLFIWGMDGHSQRTIYPLTGSQNQNPIDMRIDQSLPAFTGCSLDNDPGTGTKLKEPKPGDPTKKGKKAKPDKWDGDTTGQINKYLYWETEDIVDTTEKWEMTVAIGKGAPAEDCTVNVTPRRLQQFKAKPGDTFNWTNSSAGKEIQSGKVTADKWGLLTLENVTVSKVKNRLVIFK